MMEVFKVQAQYNYSSLDKFIDVFLEFQESRLMFEHIINALSSGCKTTSLVLTECPYSGSYLYLAMVCHILQQKELMVLWWKSADFELLFEGFLSHKSPNKQDLQCMMPSVWWPSSGDDISNDERSMMLTTTTLLETINKVTFVVSYFNDMRILSADLKDLLLQSISVLVQYKDYLAVFESNEAATQRMPKALLSAFDNISWISVTNILLRLCKGSHFGFSKHGESLSSSSSPVVFQVLEFQQRKCSVIFDLSCNLAKVLESLRRHRHSPEKVNQGMILAPLVRIISNLLDARVGMECGQQNDVVGVFASMDCPDAVHCGFQYLLEYNWG
ncbi:hypothetical protein SADUNF_Sadunf07G0074000 [Salix dunnii]|uniref:E3 ubiquitin-protein ligase RNF123/RKP TPR repeat domain-containing protein n=1 Tax=Salix dunnii TaxID=1413687 RepID=A0A835MTZ5_9ROSI|nr:hypothetical protein SADUNF_Sadunf07G0074000 [Salix dunnii]